MDVSSLLSHESARKMQSHTTESAYAESTEYSSPSQISSPKKKRVIFELIVSEAHESRARLPMVVMVSPHDTTESIIATVRTFFGVYDRPYTTWGFSFEDSQGNTMISRYENFQDNMTIYVRVRPISPEQMAPPIDSEAEAQAFLRDGGEIVDSNGSLMTPADVAVVFSGSSSPTHGRGRRSLSVQQQIGRQLTYDDISNGYSSGDGASKRSKSELLASADISLDNIVEGGRRNRAKFDSSELPLFAPPQIPVAPSSNTVSPARRSPQDGSYPFVYPNQPLGLYLRPDESPIKSPYQHTPGSYMPNMHARSRSDASYPPNKFGVQVPGKGVLPTPDPTIASCISDEDVAMQLMRLGDSHMGPSRTSTSTLDTTLAYADVPAEKPVDLAPSPMEEPARKKQKVEEPIDEAPSHEDVSDSYDDTRDDFEDDAFEPERPPMDLAQAFVRSKPKVVKKTAKPMNPKPKPNGTVRKTAPSVSSIGPDEEDLSARPRCQRCRKSKKGCDRQRPCSRCKDAGISADGCLSEDDSNGRKGRFGRHMGVTVKKHTPVPLPASPTATPAWALDAAAAVSASISSMVPGSEGLVDGDGSKKRKRV